MRKIILTAAVLAIIAAPVVAMPTGWSKIGLSADQKAKLTKIAADAREKTKALTAQIAAIKEEQRAAELAVLTDAQKQRLAEVLNEKAGLKK